MNCETMASLRSVISVTYCAFSPVEEANGVLK